MISTIHSPDFGDAQYSFSTVTPSTATFGGLYNALGSGHWRVDGWAEGTTSLGSSGAPLLDSNFGVLGGLSGSTDWEHHKSDYFFRFDLAYDHFSDPGSQLKAWVDPDGLGRAGRYQPTYKVRNYKFTSTVSETVKLKSGAVITEEFSVGENSRINGVYVSVGEVSSDRGTIITVALSQNGSELFAEATDVVELAQFSENYIPFVTRPTVTGKFAVSLKFESADSSEYITVPRAGMSKLVSYFIALNSSKRP